MTGPAETLKDVWTRVEKEYGKGVINSERCMQAVMYHELKVALPESLIYVEPTMRLVRHDGRTYKPDLVVCSQGKIDIILELKFKPGGYSEYKGDIEKFRKFGDLEICQSFDLIRPYMTASHFGEYAIDATTHFAYAVIAKFDSEAVDTGDVIADMAETLRSRFTHLYCKITPGKNGAQHWRISTATQLGQRPTP